MQSFNFKACSPDSGRSRQTVTASHPSQHAHGGNLTMTDLMESTEELTRLTAEVERLEDEIHRIANKLNNDGFISRVPAAMIEKEQKKKASFERDQAKLKEKIAAMGS
jgi:valyl-tRNA synthetase